MELRGLAPEWLPQRGSAFLVLLPQSRATHRLVPPTTILTPNLNPPPSHRTNPKNVSPASWPSGFAR